MECGSFELRTTLSLLDDRLGTVLKSQESGKLIQSAIVDKHKLSPKERKKERKNIRDCDFASTLMQVIECLLSFSA